VGGSIQAEEATDAAELGCNIVIGEAVPELPALPETLIIF
jgi:hypothetical protein